MREIESSIANSVDVNYDRILDLYPQFDSTASNGVQNQIDDVIKKASIAIQRHPGSDWVEESYVLVGKARFYDLDYVNAIETFKYVNKTSEKDDDSRHESLIQLMKTFTDAGELRNAEAVSDFLKKEKPNKENAKGMYVTRAYLHQKREDYNKMVQNLTLAAPLMSDHDERARTYFIIGQVYQQLGFNAQAYANYRNCLKSNPNFDLEFYSKLNMAQVTELTNPGDLKQVRKYFKKLLRDKKNAEFRDKIYYEIANFELKQENIEDAIENYNNSIRISTSNQRQKGYSYLRLGEIYYNHLKNYKLAKAYYDSVVSVLPKEEPSYTEIAKRQEILADFVEQLNTIHDQDSLLNLAKMDTSALSVYLDEYIAQKQAELEENEKKRKAKESSRRRSTSFDNQVTQISTTLEGSTWYFYNSSAVSRGNSEFKRQWGNRPLEDNWRRSNKEQTIKDDEQQDQSGAVATQKAPGEETATSEAGLDKSAMMASVPYTPEDQAAAYKKIEEAHYRLGNIYDFDLEEKENAIETFETMLSRFPESEYKPEVMYQLYLLYKEQGNTNRQEYYKNTLINEFPNTLYAKLIINPNFREESLLATAQLQQIYKDAYALQDSGQFARAQKLLRDALQDYPENDFSDNLKLLDIIITGHTDDIYKYQYELNSFISTYTESELLPYAENLVQKAEQHQINLFNSSRAKFIKYFAQVHYFVLAYNADKDLAEDLPVKVQRFYKTEFPNKKFSPANLILDGSTSLVMVNEFGTKAVAKTFYDAFMNSGTLDEYVAQKFSPFIITKDNFKIFYETKELEGYLKFFKENY